MKKFITISGLVAALVLGLFSYSANAKTSRKNLQIAPSEKVSDESQLEKAFTQDYDGTDVLQVLAEIKNYVENNNMEEAQAKVENLSKFLESKRFTNGFDKARTYQGDKVLEIEYGSWLNSRSLILPVTLEKTQPFRVSFFDNKVDLSRFGKNQINNAKLRYVAYDYNRQTKDDFGQLFTSLRESDKSKVIKNVEKIYNDFLIDYNNKVSLVKRVRENLIISKYLLENNQFKAAENSVRTANELGLRLIEFKSDSKAEQKRIKELLREMKNVSRVADENYISKWEQIPQEIEDWWASM